MQLETGQMKTLNWEKSELLGATQKLVLQQQVNWTLGVRKTESMTAHKLKIIKPWETDYGKYPFAENVYKFWSHSRKEIFLSCSL